MTSLSSVKDPDWYFKHTMKHILNQSWLVLRVCVCVHTRLLWSKISSHSQKSFCFPTLGNYLTLCSFHSNWFFNSFPQLKIVLNEHLGFIYQVGFHPEILSMIDMREKDKKHIQNTVTTTDVKNDGLVTFHFPRVRLVTLDSWMFLLVSRKTQKVNVVKIIADFHILKLFNCKSMFL